MEHVRKESELFRRKEELLRQYRLTDHGTETATSGDPVGSDEVPSLDTLRRRLSSRNATDTAWRHE